MYAIITSVGFGSVPEWPKGADCKSVVFDFGGPNPPAPTKTRNRPIGRFFVLIFIIYINFENNMLNYLFCPFAEGVFYVILLVILK